MAKPLSQLIHEAAFGAAQLQEASPMVAPGGRIPKTPVETLKALNAPCATCGHSFNTHMIGGEGKQCFHCMPKGSEHTYHESPDLRPHLVNVPGAGIAGPPGGGITGIVKEAVALGVGLQTEGDDGWAERLMEIYFPPRSDVAHNTVMPDRSAALLYNAHSSAAHRSSTAAYQAGGDSSPNHQVAAAHHQLAASAADSAAAKDPKNAGDYKKAAKYHNAQAHAHKAASDTVKTGNHQPYTYDHY